MMLVVSLAPITTRRGFLSRWCSCFLLVFALIAGSASDSWAGDMARAQAAYGEGYDLFQKKRYAKALRYFSGAYRWAPRTAKYARFRSALRFFVGTCHYRLRRWKLAERHLSIFVKSKLGPPARLAQGAAMLRVSRVRLRARRVKRRAVLVRKAAPLARYRPPPRPRQPVRVAPVPRRQSAPVIPRRVAPVVRRAPIPKRIVLPRPAPRLARAPDISNKPPKVARGGIHPVGPVMLGIGAAALAAGGVFIGIALGAQADADRVFSGGNANGVLASKVSGPYNNARTLAYTSYALWAGGGAIAVTGLILLFVVKRTPEPPPTAPDTTRALIPLQLP